MVKIVEFKERAKERLDRFRDDPRYLPELTHARYRLDTPKGQIGVRPARFKKFSLRTHKRHQMHSQHRESCVLVLQALLDRLDVRSRECIYVNPRKGIRCPIWIGLIAKVTNLCDRTVSRCLGSLARSRYIARSNNRIFISLSLFRDISLDLTFSTMLRQLEGLGKRLARDAAAAIVKSSGPTSTPTEHQAHRPLAKADTAPVCAPDEVSKALAQSYLAKIRSSARRRPPS